MLPYFEADSAEEMWPQLLSAFKETRAAMRSDDQNLVEGRGGSTTELLHAFLHLRDPRQRWITARRPAMNPAFALAEVIWILAGRRDSAFVNHWNPILPQFAGDEKNYHGAYGSRLRNEHGVDQLERAYEALRANPENRQVVLQIWKPSLDLPDADGSPAARDIPCNVCSLLKVRDGQLHWAQIMRSNDLILGLPHNLVQWTMIQEVLAGWLELEVGSYTHFSDSLHVYERNWDSVEATSQPGYKSGRNTDDLALSRQHFDEIFPIVESKAEAMIQSNLRVEELIKAAHFAEAPRAYRNILLILAVDTARRHGWKEEVDAFADKCDNPVLKLLWANWLHRMS